MAVSKKPNNTAIPTDGTGLSVSPVANVTYAQGIAAKNEWDTAYRRQRQMCIRDSYKLEQDRTPSYQKTFTAVVTYTRSTPTIVGIEQEFTITQEILNDSDAIQSFVESYVRRNQ